MPTAHPQERNEPSHPLTPASYLIVQHRIRVFRSAQALLQLRSLWEAIVAEQPYTVFQNFDLNLLAARIFAEREAPYVICVEASHGAAIIPAALAGDGSIRLLGEELFDYRCFLHQGGPEVLRAALHELAALGRPLRIVAIRESEAGRLPPELSLTQFCGAPGIRHTDCTAEEFAAQHLRLARNLRRLERLGFVLRRHRGDYSGLVRFIYKQKAVQDPESLFHDPLRVEFLVQAAALLPDRFEIFTLEDECSIGAVIVTLRDNSCRRFYTGWFAPELEKHSPALSLIYEITRRSLAEGMDCDYMTGEQGYKRRLATSAVQLYRVEATADAMSSVGLAPAIARVA